MINLIFQSDVHRTNARPIATTARPVPARFAIAVPVNVGSEKLPVVPVAFSEFVKAAVGTTTLLPDDSLVPVAVIMSIGVVVARATLCSDSTEATPPADVATLGIPVTMPSELVMVV
jgi:hypothetical protein